VTTALINDSAARPDSSSVRRWLAIVALIAAMTALGYGVLQTAAGSSVT